MNLYFTIGMPNPLDERLRARAVRAYEAGRGTHDEIADMFGVGPRTLQRWVARWRTGERTARPKGGGWHSPIDLSTLEAVLAEAPDATCAELCWAYNRRVGRAHQTTPTSLWRALRRAGYVVKKNGRGRVKSIGPTSGASVPRS
jgi:transposase